MQGKTVFISGASGGIGAGAARAFGKAGANVVLGARRFDRVEEIATEIQQTGGTALAVELDVTDFDSCKNAIQQVESRFGTLDLLINNAGFLGARVPFGDYPVADMMQSLQVNVAGTFQMTRCALPLLKQAPLGIVIGISSYLGRAGLPDCAGYIAGKFGVEGLTQALASEEEGGTIAAVTLAPGMVATDMLKNYLGQENLDEYLTPTQVGEAMVRCASELTAKNNGDILSIEAWLS